MEHNGRISQESRDRCLHRNDQEVDEEKRRNEREDDVHLLEKLDVGHVANDR